MLLQLFAVRLAMAKNFFKHFKTHWWFTLFLIAVVFCIIVGGGYGGFLFMFRFLEKQEIFGPLLTNLIVNIVNLIFFMMLIFSNMIILISSVFLSKETEYLNAFPCSPRSVFFLKFTETQVFSSWAFILLSIPMYLALFQIREIPMYKLFLLIPPLYCYILIPASIAALATLYITYLIPPRQSQKAFLLLVLLGLFSSIFMYKFMGLRDLVMSSSYTSFEQLRSYLALGLNPMLPNSWYSKTFYALMRNDWPSYFFYLRILIANSLLLFYLVYLSSKEIYRVGWFKAQEHNLTSQVKTMGGFVNFNDKRPLFSLILKDAVIFSRDPAQWVQILLFLGMVFVYLFNLGNFPQSQQIDHWAEALICFNIAASNFILSIITTRFIYPQISLEGQQFWIFCLAPIHKNLVIWQKFFSGLFVTLTFSIIINMTSNIILKTSTDVKLISTALNLLIGIGLTAISICLGTVTANFKETNPAKLANGSGGTLNVICSLGYLAINIFFIVKIIFPFLIHGSSHLVNEYLWVLIIFNIVVITGSLYLTFKKWERLEF